jgi:hypothetical protein
MLTVKFGWYQTQEQMMGGMRCLLYYIWIAYLLDFRLVCARL